MAKTKIVKGENNIVIVTEIPVNKVTILTEAIKAFVTELEKANLNWAVKYTAHPLEEVCLGHFMENWDEDGRNINLDVEFEEDGTYIGLEINWFDDEKGEI